jgi:Asp-tRNA(Asn)/Glu-tRNA(Gln) amidotransferase A subunit family amidase
MVGHEGPALANYSIKHLSEGIKTGKILPTELIEVSLDRIKMMNSSLNAFITVIREDKLYNTKSVLASTEALYTVYHFRLKISFM